MIPPEEQLTITADPVQTFAPFDLISAEPRLKLHGAGTTLKPARGRYQLPRDESQLTPAVIVREILTIAAIAGMFWFQIEIVRCFW